MQTTLTVTESRHEQHYQPSQPPSPQVSSLDRLALRVGAALTAWGSRPRAIEAHERRATREEQQLARQELELARDQALQYTSYPR